ncbi:Hypothetical protein SMB2099_2420 [Serratia marcescens SMB2099]|nr:Hypothetical protein SMB2099_2420 [Serratia marcescens SMB2099]
MQHYVRYKSNLSKEKSCRARGDGFTRAVFCVLLASGLTEYR